MNRRITLGIVITVSVMLCFCVFVSGWILLSRTTEPVVQGINICDLGIKSYSKDLNERTAAENTIRQLGPAAVESVLRSLENYSPSGITPAKINEAVQSLVRRILRVGTVTSAHDTEQRLIASLAVFRIIKTDQEKAAERLETLLTRESWQELCGCWAGPLSGAFSDIGEPCIPSLKRMLDRGGTSEWIALEAAKDLGAKASPLLSRMEMRLRNSERQFDAQAPAAVLAKIGEQGIEVLRQVLVDGTTEQRLAVSQELFRANETKKAGEALFVTVQNWTAPENQYGFEWPAIALATSGHKPNEAAAIFASRLSRESEIDASYAVALRLVGESGLPYLAQALADESKKVRNHAVYALNCEFIETKGRPKLISKSWGSSNDIFNYHLPPRTDIEPREFARAIEVLSASNRPDLQSMLDEARQCWDSVSRK